jgi:hypothetical protein
MAKNKKYSSKIAISETIEVPNDAVSISIVAGTPQDARVAVLNASNQTIYLSAGSSNTISADSGLIVKGSTVIEGETYEIYEDIESPSFDSQLDIESVWIQNEDIANYCLYIISSYYDMYYKSLSLKISPNPLIQIGDLAKIKIKTYKVEFEESQYWIVSSVKHKFDKGMTTDIILKPVKKVFDIKI